MPTAADLREALSRFEELLGRKSAEAEFQRLFAEHPYVLSRSLPLKLSPSDIRPLGRPGRSEPDFVAFPSQAGGLGSYGVIELKRPDSKLFKERRKGVLELSGDAQTAISQGFAYGRSLEVSGTRALMLGNRLHVFAIMGLSQELVETLGSDLQEGRLAVPLPAGCQLIPYDVLLETFAASVPPQLMVLVPAPDSAELMELLRIVEATLFSWDHFASNVESLDFWDAVRVRLLQLDAVAADRVAGSMQRIGGGGHRQFALGVVALIKELAEAARDRGASSRLPKFVANAEAILSGRPPGISPGAFELFRGLAQEAVRINGASISLDDQSADVKELEHAGLLNSFLGYAIEWRYVLHPFARFIA